ncbi:hypothetical protein J0X19_23105 [Hymenobacter sp. BT186]|uniref:Uncharacterized protein n=1 Tax=Hymenobacter telluris TaxID=2816474 RepID=A0A939JFW7_9BACT|nr:hypothetical protein [Hymenobacter telluris]MBO0360867.1 hypothetical protein [Hymenobacter telluris]MBW3376896.1 hypothetical protein [Hymenobacter norwichensis]
MLPFPAINHFMHSTGHTPREYRFLLDLVNQAFEIEKKAADLKESNSIQRNVNRLRNLFENEVPGSFFQQNTGVSFTYHNPIGERYDDTRTDCDASIAGAGTENLWITEVIKPIVWLAIGGGPKALVQKAVVVAETRIDSAFN